MYPNTSAARRVAIFVLVLANGAMAISQTNIASIYLPVSIDFHQTLYGLGLLTSIFFVGYVIFEIPGSILGAKVGPKRMATAGSALSGVALAACAFAPSFQALTVFRTLAGVGYGLFFPPCLVLIIRNLGSRSAGLGSSLTMVSFSIGGTAGILGWSILSSMAGWRISLLVESVITLAAVLALIAAVPGEAPNPAFGVRLSHLRSIVSSRATLALAISVFGGAAVANLTGSFLVYYLERSFGLPAPYAGLLGAATYIAPIFTGLAAGRLYDRGFSLKLILATSSLALTAGTALVAYPSILTALFGSVVAGLAIGWGSTASFSAARDLARMPEYESLNVSLIDAAALIGLFASPLYFSAIAAASGYPVAWALGSLAAVICVVPALLTRIAKWNAFAENRAPDLE